MSVLLNTVLSVPLQSMGNEGMSDEGMSNEDMINYVRSLPRRVSLIDIASLKNPPNLFLNRRRGRMGTAQ